MNGDKFELDFKNTNEPVIEMFEPQMDSTQRRVKEGLDGHSIDSQNLFRHDAEAQIDNQHKVEQLEAMSQDDDCSSQTENFNNFLKKSMFQDSYNQSKVYLPDVAALKQTALNSPLNSHFQSFEAMLSPESLDSSPKNLYKIQNKFHLQVQSVKQNDNKPNRKSSDLSPPSKKLNNLFYKKNKPSVLNLGSQQLTEFEQKKLNFLKEQYLKESRIIIPSICQLDSSKDQTSSKNQLKDSNDLSVDSSDQNEEYDEKRDRVMKQVQFTTPSPLKRRLSKITDTINEKLSFSEKKRVQNVSKKLVKGYQAKNRLRSKSLRA